MAIKHWKNVDRLPDGNTSSLSLIDGCYILLRKRGEGFVGKLWPMQHDLVSLTATNATDARLEIVERARVILTEALAALPGGEK